MPRDVGSAGFDTVGGVMAFVRAVSAGPRRVSAGPRAERVGARLLRAKRKLWRAGVKISKAGAVAGSAAFAGASEELRVVDAAFEDLVLCDDSSSGSWTDAPPNSSLLEDLLELRHSRNCSG